MSNRNNTLPPRHDNIKGGKTKKHKLIKSKSLPPVLNHRNRKMKPIERKIKPHIQRKKPYRRTILVGPSTPGPKYNVNVDVFANNGYKFGRSKRFDLSKPKRRASDSKLLKKKNIKLPPIKYLSSFEADKFTTRAFERYPASNVGRFPRALRNLGKGKKRLGRARLRSSRPGPGQYDVNIPYQFLHANRQLGKFPKEKRRRISKSQTPSPLNYKVKYGHLSIIRKSPSATFGSGGRDFGYGYMNKGPGPEKYSPNQSYKYLSTVKTSKFSKSKRYPKPETPGPSPMNYRPKYDAVLRSVPTTTLSLFG